MINITKWIKFKQFCKRGCQRPLDDTNCSHPQQKLRVWAQSTPNIKHKEFIAVCLILMTGLVLLVSPIFQENFRFSEFCSNCPHFGCFSGKNKSSCRLSWFCPNFGVHYLKLIQFWPNFGCYSDFTQIFHLFKSYPYF